MPDESRRAPPSRRPLSTYRLQFNRHFTFADASRSCPTSHAWAITDLYASPYLQARPGSLHGYDISNHNRLNPEIGTPRGARGRCRGRLRGARAWGTSSTSCPTTWASAQPDNDWWMDVLENGPSSPFAPYFDIDWHPLKPELAGKVLLPVLGDQFGRGAGERASCGSATREGRFRVDYHEHAFPVAPKSIVAGPARRAGRGWPSAWPRTTRPHGAGEHRHRAGAPARRATAPTPRSVAERAPGERGDAAGA